MTFLYASEKEIVIDKKTYKLTKEKYKEYGDEGLLLNFYQKNQSDINKPFFSFLLFQRSGGCGKSNYEKGTYEVKGSQVLIYTKWHGYSIDGYRKMVYEFDTNTTKAKKLSCKLYISNKEDSNSGATFLEKNPIEKKEQQLLDEYISSIEKIYKGEFVLKDEAKKLADEVNSALVKNMQNNWGK